MYFIAYQVDFFVVLFFLGPLAHHKPNEEYQEHHGLIVFKIISGFKYNLVGVEGNIHNSGHLNMRVDGEFAEVAVVGVGYTDYLTDNCMEEVQLGFDNFLGQGDFGNY